MRGRVRLLVASKCFIALLIINYGFISPRVQSGCGLEKKLLLLLRTSQTVTGFVKCQVSSAGVRLLSCYYC